MNIRIEPSRQIPGSGAISIQGVHVIGLLQQACVMANIYIYICSRTVATDHDIDSARGTPGESSSAAIADGGYGVDGAGRRVQS